MKYIRCLRCDLQMGLFRNWKHLIWLGMLVLLYCITFSRVVSTYDRYGRLDMSDYIFYIYGGMSKYIPSPTTPFVFPGMWILLHAYMLYQSLRYPREELYDIGQQFVIRSGSRVRYWLSKCGMLMIQNICYYIICISVIGVWTIAMGGRLLSEPKGMWLEAFGNISTGVEDGIKVDFWVYLMPLVTMLFLSSIQMVLSLNMGHIAPYFVMLGLLLASAYFYVPYMPGSAGMLYRSSQVTKSGGMNSGILLIGVIVAWLMTSVLGGLLFCGTDLLKKEEVD